MSLWKKLVARYGTPSQVDDVRIDASTAALISIGYEHHEIHAGSHFFVCGYDPDMDAAEFADFQLTTPNTTKWLHMVFQIQATASCTLSIYEGATVVADGVAVTAYNNNRNSSTVTGLTLLQANGTVSVPGTLIYSQAFGAATTPSKTEGGVAAREREIVLKQATTYRFRIDSDTDNNVVSWCGEWYEHTDKN